MGIFTCDTQPFNLVLNDVDCCFAVLPEFDAKHKACKVWCLLPIVLPKLGAKHEIPSFGVCCWLFVQSLGLSKQASKFWCLLVVLPKLGAKHKSFQALVFVVGGLSKTWGYA